MFDDRKMYLARDPALLVLGRPSTLAHWRSDGLGPAFIKLGARVAYRGVGPERVAGSSDR